MGGGLWVSTDADVLALGAVDKGLQPVQHRLFIPHHTHRARASAETHIPHGQSQQQRLSVVSLLESIYLCLYLYIPIDFCP